MHNHTMKDPYQIIKVEYIHLQKRRELTYQKERNRLDHNTWFSLSKAKESPKYIKFLFP